MDELVPNSAKLERGEIFQMMGDLYLSVSEYDNVIGYFRETKEKFVSACDDPNHPKIIEVEKLIRSTSKHLQNQ